MKKSLIVLITLLTFLLFSCASNKAEAPINDSSVQTEEKLSAPEITEETAQENGLDSESDENTNEEAEESEETKSNTTESSESGEVETESSEDEEEMNSSVLNETYEDLEEIEEPEVFELEPPEETEEEQEIIEEEPEVIPEEDLVTPEIEEETVISSYVEEDEVENLLDDNSEVVDLTENSDADLVSEEDEGAITQEALEQAQIEISRSVTLKKFEYVDITYPGKGWVYMGLINNSKDLTYFGRKIGSNDTKFSLQAKNSGTFIVHFYKDDSVTKEYLDDYLEIIVLEEKGSNKNHIEAPKYVPPLPAKKVSKPTVEQKPAETETVEAATPVETPVNEAKNKPVSKPAPAVEKKPEAKEVSKEVSKEVKKEPEVVKPVVTETPKVETPKKETPKSEVKKEEIPEVEEEIPNGAALYEKGISEYKQKNYKNAEKNLTLALQYSTTNKDVILFWLGQLYEAESELQNINKAIEEYTLLTNNYPASSYWDKANKRIIYLKRFYIEGR